MDTHKSLIQILNETPGALHERWENSVREFQARLTPLFSQIGIYAQVHGLLLDLVDLVERSGSVEQAVDAEFAPILDHLKALQSQHHLSTRDLVFLLFSMRDLLKDTVEAAPNNPEDLKAHQHVVTQVSLLLNRLGLVSFETAMRARDDENSPQDVLAIEYALLYERTRQMAITDPLTGLHNFGYFRDRLREERARAERYQRLLSLILLDLDHFKVYNDTNGHPAGNDVLRKIAQILKEEARETDLVARYGGEELVVLLPEANRRTAWEVAERIRARVASTEFFNMDKQPLGRVTLSAGVATFPVDAENEDVLVARADESLYLAKSQGRNRVAVYDPPDKVTLVYWPEPWVTHVALVGNFNNWDKDADPMERQADGSYRFILSLNPGKYPYKFVLNGSAWIPDPSAAESQHDDLGGQNSILRVHKTSAQPAPATT